MAPDTALLLAASLSLARVKNDESGNFRLVKTGTHNEARDDVAAALVLAAGAFERAARAPGFSFVSVPLDGGNIQTYGGAE